MLVVYRESFTSPFSKRKQRRFLRCKNWTYPSKTTSTMQDLYGCDGAR